MLCNRIKFNGILVLVLKRIRVLSEKNKTQLYCLIRLPVFFYSFIYIFWKMSYLQKIDLSLDWYLSMPTLLY